MAHIGYFVAFEGIDGCGKSTAIAGVLSRLRDLDYSCLVTQEHQLDRPTGQTINDMLKGKSPMVEPFELQKLFVLDRKDHLEHVVRPALLKGTIVLCDRYWLSTLAYGMLSDPVRRFVLLHREIMEDAFLVPDLTFLLDLPPAIAITRIQTSRGRTTYFEKLQKLEEIRKNYLSLASSRRAKVVIVNSAREPGKVADSIVHVLQPRLVSHFGASGPPPQG